LSGLMRVLVLVACVWQQGVRCDCDCHAPFATGHHGTDHDDHHDPDYHHEHGSAPCPECVVTSQVYLRSAAPAVTTGGLLPADLLPTADGVALSDRHGEWPALIAAADHRTRSQGRSLLAVYRL
jgi:hypothetical protein